MFEISTLSDDGNEWSFSVSESESGEFIYSLRTDDTPSAVGPAAIPDGHILRSRGHTHKIKNGFSDYSDWEGRAGDLSDIGIADAAVRNGALPIKHYVLHRGSGNVHRYVPAESGARNAGTYSSFKTIWDVE